MKEDLKILSIGAGAIGTYIGGSLALAGYKVIFLERPNVAEELRTRGLRLEFNGLQQHIRRPEVYSTLEAAFESGNLDFALFALKSYDTQNFIQSINPLSDRFPPILCLSNGVENESVLATHLGDNRVIAGTVTSAIGRRGIGDINLEKLRGVGIAASHPLSPKLVAAMDRAGLKAQLYPNPADMKWSKMLTNLIANASSAILDMSAAEIFSHPGLYRLENVQLREALSVMQALQIRPVDLPGTPVRLLVFAISRLPIAISRSLIAKAVGSGRGKKMPSFHIDLYSGRKKSEVDFLNGAVVRAGEKLNISTPVNSWLNYILLGLAKGEIPLTTYRRQPEKLLEEINNHI